MAYKNIIFDIDGTILNSFEGAMQPFKKAIKEVIGKELTEAEMIKYFHLSNDKAMAELGLSQDSEEVKKINELSGEDKNLPLFENITTILKTLKNNGIFLAINTSRTNQELKSVIALQPLLPLFDYIITVDKLNEPKPDPESINLIVTENNLNKKEIIMVGDSRSDAFCSKNAGIDFALALWGAFETNLPTTYKLSNVNEILNLIEKD